MNLNNLSMNYKILLGISSITILTLIFQYIKNLFNPNKRLLEGQGLDGDPIPDNRNNIIDRRYGGTMRNNNDSHDLSKDSKLLLDKYATQGKMVTLLKGIYDELGEFNHIYQERIFEQLIPSQMRKTIIHLSSIDHANVEGVLGEHKFDLASTSNSGLKQFNNVINLKLLSAQLPYIPHNIYAGNNNNNKLKVGAVIITIPEGKYGIDLLINKINNLLTNIVFSFDPITHFVSIKNTTGSSITCDITYPLFKRLGLHQELIIPDGATRTAVHIPDLSVHYIDIVSPDIHPRGSTLTSGHSTILKRIPLTGQMGDLIYYEANYSDYISQELFMPDITANPSILTLNLVRHDGTPYDLKKLHFDLKLEITELVEPTLLNELASHMRRDKDRFMKKENNIDISGLTDNTRQLDLDIFAIAPAASDIPPN